LPSGWVYFAVLDVIEGESLRGGVEIAGENAMQYWEEKTWGENREGEIQAKERREREMHSEERRHGE
jgi:hypothetical protein